MALRRTEYPMSDGLRRLDPALQWAGAVPSVVGVASAGPGAAHRPGAGAVLRFALSSLALTLGWFGRRRVFRRDTAARAAAGTGRRSGAQAVGGRAATSGGAEAGEAR